MTDHIHCRYVGTNALDRVHPSRRDVPNIYTRQGSSRLDKMYKQNYALDRVHPARLEYNSTFTNPTAKMHFANPTAKLHC